MINKTQAFVRANLDWIGVDFLDPSNASQVEGTDTPSRQVRVLDYACGPGTITDILQGHATEFVGIDISQNMVKTYNQRFQDHSSEAFVGDLLVPDNGGAQGGTESVSGSRFFDFDLVVVGYGFHHFENLEPATSRLVSRLRPGGVFLIVDFVTHAKIEDNVPANRITAHLGFGEEDVKSIFGTAGLVDVGVVEMEGTIEMKKPGAGDDEPGHKRKVFLGRGRKPA